MKSAVLSLLLAGSRVQSAGWTYPEQEQWGETFEMCDTSDQSPIDIRTDEAINDDYVCTKNFEWNVNYNHTTFRLANNGHSLVLVLFLALSANPHILNLNLTLFLTHSKRLSPP